MYHVFDFGNFNENCFQFRLGGDGRTPCGLWAVCLIELTREPDAHTYKHIQYRQVIVGRDDGRTCFGPDSVSTSDD
jgi:hypothetical protein